MAKLSISEFSGLGYGRTGGAMPTVPLPPLASQSVPIGAASISSNAFSTKTSCVRLFADIPCRVEVALDPTALPVSMPLVAGAAEYFNVSPGFKIAVIGGA